MTEPQVWTMIALFGTLFAGLLATVAGMVIRVVRSEVSSLHIKMDAGFSALRAEMSARFEAVDARFEKVDARFDAVDARLDHLDGDVTALMRHVFKADRG